MQTLTRVTLDLLQVRSIDHLFCSIYTDDFVALRNGLNATGTNASAFDAFEPLWKQRVDGCSGRWSVGQALAVLG